MKPKSIRYFLRVSNPQKGTFQLLKELCQEFKLILEEYWLKKDDPDIRLSSEPLYPRNFNHIVMLYSGSLNHIEFARFTIERFIKKIEELEFTYKKETGGF